MFHWRSWFLFDLCTRDVSTDFCNEREKNKTDMEVSTLHVCEILAQRWDRRFGGFSRQTLPPSNSRAWHLDRRVSHSSPVSTADQDKSQDVAVHASNSLKGTDAA